MAKIVDVKVLNVDRVLKSLDDLLKESTQSTGVLNAAGKMFVDRIKFNTRRGKSLALGGEKFRDLEDITKAFRLAYKKAGGLVHDTFSPNRSNLTLTGQMLDALKYEIEQDNGQIKIFVEDSARNPDLPSGDKTNAELAEANAKLGRPFIGVDDNGMKRLKLMLVEQIRRISRAKGFTK